MAAPASHGPFHYSYGELHAEASNGNRHRRTTLPELQDFFRPSAQFNSASSSQQDRPAHWFEAQLLHYGLPPSKTKGTAFRRLHDAFTSSHLAVPAEISTIEKNLKKQWESSQRQARGKQPASSRVGPSGGVTKPGAAATKKETPKRKAETVVGNGVPAHITNGMNINVTVNMAATPTKRPKATARKTTTAVDMEEPPKRKLQTAKWPGGPPGMRVTSSSDAKSRMKPRAPSQPKVKEEPRTRVKSEPGSSGTALSSSQYLSPPRPRYIKPESDEDVYMRSAPSLSPSPSQSPEPGPLGLINGIYTIRCPYVTEQWDVNPRDMNMHIAIDTNQTWGSYYLGMFSGIFRVHSRPWRGSGERLALSWRGREHGEGEMTVGDDNEGWISFLGQGRIRGCLEICGSFEFQGFKDEGAGPGQSKGSMSSEWMEYSDRNYEYERVNRWR